MDETAWKALTVFNKVVELEQENKKLGEIVAALVDLIRAAKAFLSDSVIVETTGTIPLLDALFDSINKAEVLLSEVTE